MTKVTALTNLASVLLSETSAIKVHEYPPESLSEMPCFVLEWTSGVLGMAAASSPTNELCTLIAAYYHSRQVLPGASENVRPVIDEVRDACNGNASLSSACVSIEEVRFNGPGGLDYTDASGRTNVHYGIRFEIDIRFKDNTTWAL